MTVVDIESSDGEILEEIKKIVYLYRLKKTLRYNSTRDYSVHSESVAEHIYGMFILAHYFLPLTDTDSALDRERIYGLILYHDIDEIETGDIVYTEKTENHKALEIKAAKKVVQNAPLSMRNLIATSFSECHKKTSPEAKFVNAIDKLEPIFELFDVVNMKSLKRLNFTTKTHEEHKQEAIKDFPIMKRFLDVSTEYFQSKNAFAGQPI